MTEVSRSQSHFPEPFYDPTLVTTAFLDILWQDADGHNALMLAVAENRVVHVKAILALAHNTNKIAQVLDMRNNEGHTALDIALMKQHSVAAQLIQMYASTRERRMSRRASQRELIKKLNSFESETSEKDITLELDGDKPPLVPLSAPVKFNNNIRRFPSRENILRMRRSRSSHAQRLRMEHQRTISNDSLPTPPPLNQQAENGLLTSIGEKLRNLMNPAKKEEVVVQKVDESSMVGKLSHPSSSLKGIEATDSQDECSFMRSCPGDNFPSFGAKKDETKESKTDNEDNAFRSSPWSDPPPHSQTGVKLPPLMNLRRRVDSESRSGRQSRFVVHDESQGDNS